MPTVTQYADTTRKYGVVLDTNEHLESENKHQILKLTKEKNELLDLVMQRGKTIEVCCDIIALIMDR